MSRFMNLDTLTLLKLANHSDNNKSTKWIIFYIFISTNSKELSTTTSTTWKLAISFVYSEHLTIIVLKGKILVPGEKPCFNYWAILSLQFFLPVLCLSNDFPSYFIVLENADIHTKLL